MFSESKTTCLLVSNDTYTKYLFTPSHYLTAVQELVLRFPFSSSDKSLLTKALWSIEPKSQWQLIVKV